MKLINKYSRNVVKAMQWRALPTDNNNCMIGKKKSIAKVLNTHCDRFNVDFESRRLYVVDSMTEPYAEDTDFVLIDDDNNIFVANVSYMNDNYEFYGR